MRAGNEWGKAICIMPRTAVVILHVLCRAFLLLFIRNNIYISCQEILLDPLYEAFSTLCHIGKTPMIETVWLILLILNVKK